MPGATIAPTGTFFDLKIEEFQRVLELNLTGTVLPTQVFLKPMVEQKAGAIVNFSSMAAFRPMTRVAGYAAAKAGISNFTAFMATEVAKKVWRRYSCKCHRTRIFPHRAEPCPADEPGWKLHGTWARCDPPNSLRTYGPCRRALRNHPIPHQRCFQLCHRYGGCSGRRVQRIRDVNSKLQIIKQ